VIKRIGRDVHVGMRDMDAVTSVAHATMHFDGCVIFRDFPFTFIGSHITRIYTDGRQNLVFDDNRL
jgi:hypothetical protein